MNEIIITDFFITDNSITNLEGLDRVKSIKEFYASRNPELTSLVGIPKSLKLGLLMVRYCGLKNLIGAPKYIERLDVEGNKEFISLDGAPEYIEYIDVSRTGRRFSEREVREAMPTIRRVSNYFT